MKHYIGGAALVLLSFGFALAAAWALPRHEWWSDPIALYGCVLAFAVFAGAGVCFIVGITKRVGI